MQVLDCVRPGLRPQQATKEPAPAPQKAGKKPEAKIEAGIRIDGKRVFVPEPVKQASEEHRACSTGGLESQFLQGGWDSTFGLSFPKSFNMLALVILQSNDFFK